MEKNEQGYYVLSADKKNHITRLLTQEYSFYTQNLLTLKQFESLMESFLKEAQGLHFNTHLVLSSFAVLDEHLKVLNLTCYLEGGQPPRYRVISKNMSAHCEPAYYCPPFSQTLILSDSKHANAVVTAKGMLLNTNSIFEVETAGGAKYIQIAEICLDHALGHGLSQFKRTLKAPLTGVNKLSPAQFDQCVVSHSVHAYDANTLPVQLVHVDPIIQPEIDFSELDECDEHALAEIVNMFATTYEEMEGKLGDKQYCITAPPFGPSIKIGYLNTRTLSKVRERYVTKYDELNRNGFQASVVARLRERHPDALAYLSRLYRHFEVEKQCLHGVFSKACRDLCLMIILNNNVAYGLFDETYRLKQSDNHVIKNRLQAQFDSLGQILNTVDKDNFLGHLKHWKKEMMDCLETMGQDPFMLKCCKRRFKACFEAAELKGLDELLSLISVDPASLAIMPVPSSLAVLPVRNV